MHLVVDWSWVLHADELLFLLWLLVWLVTWLLGLIRHAPPPKP